MGGTCSWVCHYGSGHDKLRKYLSGKSPLFVSLFTFLSHLVLSGF